jgi:hypothetical protein
MPILRTASATVRAALVAKCPAMVGAVRSRQTSSGISFGDLSLLSMK